MFKRRKPSQLAADCKQYLDAGPPDSMKQYVPGSITEIIIALGARSRTLDAEMMELASLIELGSESYKHEKDPAVRNYMLRGAELVRRVAAAH